MDKHNLIIILLIVLFIVVFIGGIYLYNKCKQQTLTKKEPYLDISRKMVDSNIDALHFGTNQTAEEQRIQYIKHPELSNKFAKQNSLPVDVFNRIAQVEPSLPNSSDIENSFRQCIQSGQTFQACLTESGAGSQPEMCRSLCEENYGALNKVCSTICYNQISQQRNSCSGGPC